MMNQIIDPDRRDPNGPPRRSAMSVSQLTDKIKLTLEDKFDFVWISGEISNFKIPASGHAYFTLKDTGAQISAVLFRAQRRGLGFEPADGCQVLGLGRLSLYPPRGTYQLIFEYLEPFGAGALLQAFEALKAKLAAEGLFAAAHKRPLPFLPRKISVITSATGAVFHDICHVAARRFPNLAIQLVPATVQGAAAVSSVVRAIEMANRHASADLIILARGGGSLEDLQAFNSEPVARAIAASNLPVVSAIGHETDFTIADFVADLRAPTPSAAAEVAVPSRDELVGRLQHLKTVLLGRWRTTMQWRRARISEMTARLASPRRRVDDARLHLDDLEGRLRRALQGRWRQDHRRIEYLAGRLRATHPRRQLAQCRQRMTALTDRLIGAHRLGVAGRRQQLAPLAARLTALNPLAVLERGYSITRTLPERTVIRQASDVGPGDPVEILLARGTLEAGVTRIGGIAD